MRPVRSAFVGQIANCGGMLLALLGAPTPAAAADGREISERDYLADLPVVLSVSRLAQPQADAPASVTVIDRELIRASGARDLSEVLRLVPGIFVVRPPQSAPEVVYHGLTGAFAPRIQVLVDGRTQYGAFFFGGVNWNLIPVALDDIERIEVVRGSNSAAHGSNAFLGVVSIQTRRGSATPAVTAEVRRGQGGISDDMVRIAAATERFEFRLTGQTTRDDGIDFVDDGRTQRLVDGRVDARLGPGDELGLRFAAMENGLRLGFPGREGNPTRDRKEAQDFVQVDWRHVIDSSADLSLRYFHSREHVSETPFVIDTRRLDNRPPGYYFNSLVPVAYRADTKRDDFELQHTLAPRPDLRAVWGFGWRRDRVEAPAFFGMRASVARSLVRLFGNVEWQPAEVWRLNLGATHERDSLVGTMTAPRLSANLRLADWASARASVSRAYRSPSLFETQGDQIFVSTDGVVREHQLVGRQDLRPESLLARELGLVINFPARRLSADIRAFDEQVSDIAEQSVPTAVGAPYCAANAAQLILAGTGYCNIVGLVTNTENVRIRGIEYSLDYRPLPSTRLVLNQAFVKLSPTTIIGAQTGLPANPLLLDKLAVSQTRVLGFLAAQIGASAPTHGTTLAWTQKLPGGFELSAFASWVGAMKWATNTEAGAVRRIDWRLGYSFRVGPTRGELSFAVQADGGSRPEYDVTAPNSKRGFASLRLDI